MLKKYASLKQKDNILLGWSLSEEHLCTILAPHVQWASLGITPPCWSLQVTFVMNQGLLINSITQMIQWLYKTFISCTEVWLLSCLLGLFMSNVQCAIAQHWTKVTYREIIQRTMLTHFISAKMKRQKVRNDL